MTRHHVRLLALRWPQAEGSSLFPGAPPPPRRSKSGMGLRRSWALAHPRRASGPRLEVGCR